MRKIGNNTVANATARLSGNTRSTYRDLLDFSKAPWQPKFMDFQDGVEYRFDVIPYTAQSKKDPLVFWRKLMVGDGALTLDVAAHRLGPTFSKVLCPSTYGKPCESCDLREQGYETVKAMNIPRVPKGQVNEAYSKATDQHVKPWRESMRTFCWARPYEKRGAQWVPLTTPMVIEISAAFFSKALYAQLSNQASASSVDVQDVVNGYSIFVRAAKGKLGGVSLETLSLVPRTVAVPDEMEEACFSLSEYLVETSSKEIKELCYGAEPDMPDQGQATDTTRASTTTPLAYTPPAPSQPEQPTYTAPAPSQPPYQASSGPQAYTAPDQGMQVDFGDVAGLEYGDKCPSGHRFARDVGKKPECAACKFVEDCTRVNEAD